MMNKVTMFETKAAEELNEMAAKMLKTIGTLNIDTIETKFESTCQRCRLNKDCKNCANHNAFVKLLNY